MRATAHRAAELGVQTELLRVRTRHAVQALLEVLHERDAGLLVFGPTGKLRFRRAARRVRREATCLVWIAPMAEGGDKLPLIQVCTTNCSDQGEGMADKTWGGEPFWGLGYDWDPDWLLTERQKELRAKLIDLCERRDARQREALGRRAALPAAQLRDPRRERLPLADRARGVRRARREPRGLHDGLRDARALRLRLHGHVLRHAHGRGGDDHAAADAGADREVHQAAERLQDRHAVVLGPRDRLALLVPVLLEAPSARTAASRSTRRRPGRPRAASPTSTWSRPRAPTSRATTTCRCS